jgi:ADP-ribose pyrophosphatase
LQQEKSSLSQSEQPWQALERRHLYRSPWRDFVVDRVRTHTGAEVEYGYVQTPDAVLIVPLTADGKIVLVRQYRWPVREWVWEVPAGAVGDEAPAEAARRELEEEIGSTGAQIEAVSSPYGVPSLVSSRHHIFFATGVRLAETKHEPTELIEIVPVAPKQALAWARSGEIQSAECAFALLVCEPRIRAALEQGAKD